MGVSQDLSNHRFGRLIAIRPNGKTKDGYTMWLCKCDCGNETTVKSSNLKYGKTKSCGCLQTETRSKNHKLHGLCKTRLYNTWQKMKNRCYTPYTAYDKTLYKDRGITVCDEWLHNFKAFYDWAMANGWREEKLPSGRNKLTLDRIDNNKGYSPQNCRWVDMKTQCQNRRKKSKNGSVKHLTQIPIRYRNVERK